MHLQIIVIRVLLYIYIYGISYVRQRARILKGPWVAHKYTYSTFLKRLSKQDNLMAPLFYDTNNALATDTYV